MRLPDSHGRRGLRAVIATRGDTYEVTRQTGVEDIGHGETRPTTETVFVDVYVFDPTESNSDVIAGEQLDGDLNGLAEAEADVQPNDVYTYLGEDYSVTTSVDVGNGVLQRFGLERVTNS